MDKAFTMKWMKLLISIAVGLVCLSPRFCVSAGEPDAGTATGQESLEYDFFLDGSGKSITEEGLTVDDESAKALKASMDRKSSGMSLASVGSSMSVSEAGVEFIASYEGLKLKAYKAVSTEKYYTIGYGHYGPDVDPDMTITKEEALILFRADLKSFDNYVNKFIDANHLTLNQKQFDALVSFSYNVGTRWMTSSTIRTYLLNGIKNYSNEEIYEAFGKWNTSGGAVLAGLTRRRRDEATMFLGGPMGIYSVTSVTLNIRSGAGTSYRKTGQLVRGDRITIREIKDTWGRFEKGWVSLTYCQFEAPSAILKSAEITASGVKLSWESDSEAVKYNVMRKEGAGDAELVATTEDTSYTDTSVANNTTYSYYVNSIEASGAITVEDASVSAITVTYYSAPKLKKVTNTTDGVMLTWAAVDGGVKYRIYRKEESGTYRQLADASGQSYLDQTALSGKNYTYTVSVVGLNGCVSSYNLEGLTILRLASPTNIQTKNTSAGIKITWSAPSGAALFQLYRKKNSGSWKKVADVKSKSYTDTSVKGGAKFQYRLRCIDSTNAACKSVWGTGTAVTCLKVTTVTLTRKTYGVQVKWKKVTGATSYKVYRRVGETGKWKCLGQVKAGTVTYQDKTASNKLYYYRVRSYRADSVSAYSKIVEIAKAVSASAGKQTFTVTSAALNIRSGAGTQYKLVGKLSKGNKVTITKVQNGWGKCSKGWVCLTYGKLSSAG